MRPYDTHDPKTKLISVAIHDLSLSLPVFTWLTWAYPKELPTLLSVSLVLLSPERTSSLLCILLFSQTRMSIPRRMEISPTSLALVGLALSTARGQCAWQKCSMPADSCAQPGEGASRRDGSGTCRLPQSAMLPLHLLFSRRKTKWTVGLRGRTSFLMALNETLALR